MDHDVAIITGGAGELGRGTCTALAAAGAKVVIIDRDISAAVKVDRAFEFDVVDPAACANAVEEVVKEFGGVSLLVNLAHTWSKMPLMETTQEAMQTQFESGPMATLRMMQLCYPHMKAQGGGTIVNVTSASGTQGGIPGEGLYAGAKEAIRGISKHACVEWGPDNIRINVICPVATDNPNRWGPTVVDRIPLRRLGDPTIDFGGTIVYLASPAGSFMTGRTIFLDGGAGMYR